MSISVKQQSPTVAAPTVCDVRRFAIPLLLLAGEAARDAGAATWEPPGRMGLRVLSLHGLRVAVALCDPLHPYPHLLDGSLADPQGILDLVEAARAARLADILRLRFLPVGRPDGLAGRLPWGATIHVHHAQRASFAAVGTSGSAFRSPAAFKRRRRLADTVGVVRLAEPDGPAERTAALKSLLAWKRAWLRAHRLPAGGFNDPTHLAALREAAVAGERVGFRVFTLRAGERTAAVECGFRGPNAHLATVAAFDPAHAAYGPGVMLTGMVMERCAEEGSGFYDFLPPETPFKARFADDRPAMIELRVPLTGRGRLALLAFRAFKSVRPDAAAKGARSA